MSWQRVKDRGMWEEKLQQPSWTPFAQSWAWGEFQKKCGREVCRLVWVEEGAWKMMAQFIRYRRLGGSYWFASRGPVFLGEAERDAVVLLNRAFGKPIDLLSGFSLFTRLEPRVGSVATMSSWQRRPSLSPSTTLLTDLRQETTILQGAMHTKTRYNIRVAERHGITVREGTTEKDFDLFWRLTEETAKRDGFLPHAKNYLHALWRELSESGIARLRLAEWEGKVLAANLEIAYGDTVTYLHGASTSEARQTMAPYALHWSAMQGAKAEGRYWYDWWGCNPEDQTAFDYKSTWDGITRFKLGWGGNRVSLMGTWDVPRYPLLYKILSKYRGWR